VDEAFDLHAFLQWRDPFGRRLPRGVQLDAHTRETLLTVSGVIRVILNNGASFTPRNPRRGLDLFRAESQEVC
jgi:hypothetical protein